MSVEKVILKKLRGLKRMLTKPEGLTQESIGPVSRWFARDRGTPIDRYYIEKFLNENRLLIKGNVLEVESNTYTVQFGSDVISSDVLHVTNDNPLATIVADLTKFESLPANKFHCFICTQTLNFIYDITAAIKGSYKLLEPGGSILATVAGISQISRSDMEAWGDYWRFTTLSAQRAFADVFGENNVSVDHYGNCLAASSFLKGIAKEELPEEKLDVKDEDYPVTVTIIAKKESASSKP